MASPLRMAKSSRAAPLHRQSHSVSFRSLPLFSILNPVRRKGFARARLRGPTNKSKDMGLLVDVEELFVVYRISFASAAIILFAQVSPCQPTSLIDPTQPAVAKGTADNNPSPPESN